MALLETVKEGIFIISPIKDLFILEEVKFLWLL